MLPSLAHLNRKKTTPHTAVNATTPIPGGSLIALAFDGSCNPNPGPMGVGYTLTLKHEDEGEARVIARVGAQIGQGTNNEAEYHALLAGLRHALKLGFLRIVVQSDSKLVVEQVTGRWKAKKGRLRQLRDEAVKLMALFSEARIEHVYRENNADADALSRTNHFEAPSLPSPISENPSRYPKALHAWQAALIRVHYLRGTSRTPGFYARIFGTSESSIATVCEGRTYTDATFDGYADFQAAISA